MAKHAEAETIGSETVAVSIDDRQVFPRDHGLRKAIAVEGLEGSQRLGWRGFWESDFATVAVGIDGETAEVTADG